MFLTKPKTLFNLSMIITLSLTFMIFTKSLFEKEKKTFWAFGDIFRTYLRKYKKLKNFVNLERNQIRLIRKLCIFVSTLAAFGRVRMEERACFKGNVSWETFIKSMIKKLLQKEKKRKEKSILSHAKERV